MASNEPALNDSRYQGTLLRLSRVVLIDFFFCMHSEEALQNFVLVLEQFNVFLKFECFRTIQQFSLEVTCMVLYVFRLNFK